MRTSLRTSAGISTALALAFVGVGAATTASHAATVDDEPITPTPIGTSCVKRVETDVDTGDGTKHRVGVYCETIGDGVQVRIVLAHDNEFDAIGEWQTDAGTWHTMSAPRKWDDYRIEFRADPDGGSADYTATIETVYERTFGYDDHAVKMTCSHIPAALEVRGGADFTYQSDVHTPWITAVDTTVWSPGQQRTVPAMPVAFTEYRLRGW